MSPLIIKKILSSSSIEDLSDFAIRVNEPKFRAKQLHDWVYNRRTLELNSMSNLPASFRVKAATEFAAPSSKVIENFCSADGSTKLLIQLSDNNLIEMVIIPSEERLTFCLSTQVGCPVGCFFCASGANGLVRNLRAGEIIEQIFHGAKFLKWPDNLVFMGTGEGLLNFDELTKALELITSPDYYGMGVRHLTVSTSGYLDGIRRLADLGKEYNLAISLHAPDDQTRAKLIPEKWCSKIADVMLAADYYREKAGRMVTLEYALLDSINDSTACAKKLAELAKKHHAKVNLIPYNETGGKFKRPPESVIRKFMDIIIDSGAHVTLRRSRGGDSRAACGQLRALRPTIEDKPE